MAITGGSRGVGAVSARQGRAVCFGYRASKASTDALVAEIEAGGGKVVVSAVDVSSGRHVIDLFDPSEAAHGPIDGLVDTPDIVAAPSRLADKDLERWNAVLATNLTGAFLRAREAVRRMTWSTGGAGGAIFDVSSISPCRAPRAISSTMPYRVRSRRAHHRTGEGCRPRRGLRERGSLGLIDTAIHVATGDGERVERPVSSVPMQRIGISDEVAKADLWLLSDGASYCTDTIINVGGGR